jgi:SAM-dependent methyltransferase
MDYRARLAREAERWAPAAKAESGHGNWMRLAAVQRHIDACVTGRPGVQWAEGIGLEFLAGRVRDGRGVTLGCSDGGAERHALASGLFRSFDGFDISPAAVAAARRLAAAQGLDVRYQVADVNFVELPPRSYDLAVVVMALHHFERLEHVLDQVAAALKPSGLLVFNEYVGPDRFQWTERQLGLGNEALARIPASLRAHADGRTVTAVERPDPAQLARTDPFEAIRSAAIVPLVRERFTILAERPYGGTILHPLLNGIAQNFDETLPQHARVLQELIAFETGHLRAGLPSDFTVVVAGPR